MLVMQRGYGMQGGVPGGAPPIRNPWIERHPDSSSSSASRSARSLRRTHHPHHIRTHTVRPAPGPGPASEWLRPGGSGGTARLHGPLLNQAQPCIVPVSSVGSSHSPTDSVNPHSHLHTSNNCAKCDSFCYHCLQVVYIAGILTGVSLVIAGSVLRGSPRRGDLLVLVYIGVLLAAVCTLLLSVHYCVRNSVKQRKRALRVPRLTAAATHVQQDGAELQELAHVLQPRHPHDFTDVRIEHAADCVDARASRPHLHPHPHPHPYTDVHDPRSRSAALADVIRHRPDFGDSRQHSGGFGSLRHHPEDLRYFEDMGDASDVRRSGRSRSSHSSHGRRYYLQDEPEMAHGPHEWDRDRQPYLPLIHRPPR